MKLQFILTILLLSIGFSYAQNSKEREKIISNYDLQKLEQIKNDFAVEFSTNHALALELAKQNGWELKITKNDGSLSELVGVTEDLRPIYHTTDNENAGITSRANTLYPGGSLGLSVTGNGMTLGLWEIDATRSTHQLYEGRVQQVDADVLSDHATHVAGTIIGSNAFQGGSAKGMAYDAQIRAFNSSNDEAEVASEAASGNLISSHSYGIPASGQPSYYLGKYDANARDFDQIMYNAPYYLGVFSAGNDRNDGINATGYDLLTDMSCNKNGITVAAVSDVANYTGSTSVNMSSFSSWGPTDDGRIKPDISANGVSLYSASSAGDSSYGNKSGTSMATPSTSGTLLLLQQYYNNIVGNFMRAATLRGLACHTADETGDSDGPDYEFGWGLLNAERAAQTITDRGSKTIISELSLNPGQVYTVDVSASGLEDLMASICWTDPHASVGANITNDRTPSLVNDLDIRITKSSSTYSPWILDPDNPSFAATSGDNVVDNIEKIEIANPSGTYTITVSHKGSLSGGKQDFSLIVTGLNGVDCNGDYGGTAYIDDCGICVGGNTGLTPCITYCSSTYTQTGSEYISNVQFNTIDNSSSDASSDGYEDFTSISSTAIIGQTYPINITINTNGNYLDHCQVFFDWNNDMDFSDADEMVDLGDITNVTAGVLTENVTVPAGAASGASIRMRVNLEYNVNPGACDADHSTEWGETEDYTIIVANAVDCNGDANGTAYIDNCGNCVGGNTGLTPCVQDCNGDWGGSAYIDDCGTCVEGNTGLTPCVTYCTSTYTQAGSEYIVNVSFNTIDNSSSDASVDGYEDYTSISTTVNRGESYPISVTINTSGNYLDQCQVFFDWNNDMDFSDADEMVDLGNIANVTAGVLTGNVAIPTDATIGSTRIRVNIEYNVDPGACDTDHASEWGETEDYSLYISSPIPAPIANFTANSNNICEGESVTFTDISSGNPSSWSWNFGDGSPIVTTQNPTHTYTNAGAYSVTLTANNSGGSDDESKANFVTVNPVTVITTQPTGASVCEGESLTLNITATGNNLTYLWKKGTGTIETNSNSYTITSITPTDAGNYSCIVTGSCTSETSNTATINVNPLPTAVSSATASQSAICNGASSTLSYNGGSGTTFSWYTASCGGSFVGSGNHLSVMPETNTSYYGRWENSCGISTCETVNIDVNNTPTPSFTFNTSLAPLVSFVNTSSNADSYLWDFGDGSNAVGTNTSHEYVSNSIFNVILYATNDCGTTNSQENITITNIGITSINNKKIEVYPNPTESILNINLDIENVDLQLINMDGKVLRTVTSRNNKQLKIDLDDLASGVYGLIIHPKNEEQRIVKIIKQ